MAQKYVCLCIHMVCICELKIVIIVVVIVLIENGLQAYFQLATKEPMASNFDCETIISNDSNCTSFVLVI